MTIAVIMATSAVTVLMAVLAAQVGETVAVTLLNKVSLSLAEG